MKTLIIQITSNFAFVVDAIVAKSSIELNPSDFVRIVILLAEAVIRNRASRNTKKMEHPKS
jgi:hypothetical protein